MTTSRNAECHCGSGKKYKKCCLGKDEAQRKPHTGHDAVIVCLPTRGQISHETLIALEYNMPGIAKGVLRVARKPIVEARNALARQALEKWRENPFPFTPRETYVLWLDDDAWFPPGLVAKMLECMNDPRVRPRPDALFGKFGQRIPYSPVLARRKHDDADSFPREGFDCTPGEIVPIEGAGFHLCLMRMSLLDRIGPEPFTIPEGSTDGEDFAFCKRAKAIGANLAVGMGFPVVHVDPRDGMAYIPGMPPSLLVDNMVQPISLEHASAGSIKTVELREYGNPAFNAVDLSNNMQNEIASEIETRRKVSDAPHER